MRRMIKLYDAELEEIRKRYGLSKIEITIIGFLHNNPGRDTVCGNFRDSYASKGKCVSGCRSADPERTNPARRDEKRTVARSILPCAGLRNLSSGKLKLANSRYEKILYRGISEEELRLYRGGCTARLWIMQTKVLQTESARTMRKTRERRQRYE